MDVVFPRTVSAALDGILLSFTGEQMKPGAGLEACVDIYCERTGPGLWAEPLNALTNLAFFAAAWGVWRTMRRSNSEPAPFALLIALIVAIGIGSTLFHTFATTWAQLLDLTPILLFQSCFIWLYVRRIIRLSRPVSALILIGFLAAELAGGRFREILNGSLAYAPGLLLLSTFGAYHYLTGKRAHRVLIAAVAVFLVAVTFRSIDMAVCPFLPFGTHFLWHLLNGAVLYLAVKAMALSWQDRALPA